MDTSSDIFDLTKKLTNLRNSFVNEEPSITNWAEYYQSVLRRLTFVRNKESKPLKPVRWGRFSSLLHTSKQVISYRRKVIISTEELTSLEEDIYFYFVKRQLRKGAKRKSNRKK